MIITFLDIVIIMLTVAVSNITEKPMMIMTTLWKCALNKNDQDDEDMVFPLIC